MSQSPQTATALDQHSLIERFRGVRGTTMRLTEPLSAEDMVVQAAACASPTKWHLAHTTWFFETFVLGRFRRGYREYDERFGYLFNSYYNTVGPMHPRSYRGLLTRPGIGEVMAFRDTIDERVEALIGSCDDEETYAELAEMIELGLHHEQQHQELVLTDAKLLLHANPLLPSYAETEAPGSAAEAGAMGWLGFDGGVVEIGREGEGFAYDNEGPRHRRFLEPYALADRTVTNAEFLAFVEDGGYERAALWLDEGWSWVGAHGVRHPLMWRESDDGWREFTLYGERALDPHAPACHLSFFEADAFARWSGARLPTEVEWEHACEGLPVEGCFVESRALHPIGAGASTGTCALRGMFGSVWEWTRSAHEPFPGYAPPPGAIGEYNGKFMCGQFVLRGGSVATSVSHIRPTYRNFFEPDARWQFTGVRLARSTR